VRELSERYSVGGVRLAYQYLNAAFQAAVTDGLIAKSPCQRIRLPMTEEAPVVTLADEQIQALRDAMPERYAAVVLLGADAGLRASEARAVTVDRVDFLRRTLTVDRQVDNAGAFVPLKTKSARRTVPLGDALLEVLAEHFRRFPSNSGFLVETSGGKPLRMQRLQTLFQRAVEKSGLRARFHDLRRHTYASRLLANGASITAVQRALGHASARTTLGIYAHALPDADDDIRAALGRLADFSRTPRRVAE
jgi:integrase